MPSTTAGDLPPSSKMQGTKFYAAAAATNFPFSVPPVNMIISTFYLVMFFATSTPPKENKYLYLIPSMTR